MEMRIAWSVAHQEFTIDDYYYFSKLRELISRLGADLVIIEDIRDLSNYQVIVFNYPEKKFTDKEKEELHRYMTNGGRVIILGYYNNEDRVAEYINSFTKNYGILVNDDAVIDKVNKVDEEGLFIVSSRVYFFNKNVKKVLLPCTASIRSLNPDAVDIVRAEETAFSNKYGKSISVFKLVKVGAGELIIGGTCVFWDNFSIDAFNNKEFAINLLNRNQLI